MKKSNNAEIGLTVSFTKHVLKLQSQDMKWRVDTPITIFAILIDQRQINWQ